MRPEQRILIKIMAGDCDKDLKDSIHDVFYFVIPVHKRRELKSEMVLYQDFVTHMMEIACTGLTTTNPLYKGLREILPHLVYSIIENTKFKLPNPKPIFIDIDTLKHFIEKGIFDNISIAKDAPLFSSLHRGEKEDLKARLFFGLTKVLQHGIRL